MKAFGTFILACITGISFAVTGAAQDQGVRKIKTSWKSYSVITYQGLDVLCEPYAVKKNDWLYKIFKQKGEISAKDFPLFISIFKQINPHIHDIDTIPAGARILIPLKISDHLEYPADKDGRVNIPVVEFNGTLESSAPQISVQEHVIVPGDTVSTLVDPIFLNEGGGINREGQSLFYQLNPHIKNIDRIFPGDRITIPTPAMMHGSTLRKPTPLFSRTISSNQLQELQNYAAAINGRLVHQGKLHFPGRNGQKEVQLDLSETPLIETGEPGKSILIFPERSPQHSLQDNQTRQTISAYWKHVTFQPMEAIFRQPVHTESKPIFSKSGLSRKQILHMVEQTGFDCVPQEIIRFQIKGIPVSARLDRVIVPDRTDLLLNFGTIFGQGIEALRQKKTTLLSFNPDQNPQEQIRSLLSALGFTVWDHPSFTYQGAVETLPGIYGEQSSNRVLVSSVPLTPGARLFMKSRQIRHVLLQP